MIHRYYRVIRSQPSVSSALLRCCRSGIRYQSTTGYDAPVIIAGGGPVGIVTSMLLAKFGVPTIVVDRGTGPTPHPQAHFINCRTMEVLRTLSVGLADTVFELSEPTDVWRRFEYCTSITGTKMGTVDHFGEDECTLKEMRAQSPCRVAHLPQSKLVPLIIEQLKRTEMSQMIWSHDVTGFKESADGVNVEIVDMNTKQTRTLRGAYLVGCDGAHSTIRGLMGIKMVGDVGLQHLINVHFTAPDLWYVAGKYPAILYFVFNPSVVGVIVGHDLKGGECVIQIPYFPPHQTLQDFTPEVCRGLIQKAIGVDTMQVNIHQINNWVMSAINAESYGRNRVWLAGDACHRMPPAGGFGMNSGVCDAHNLAWRLAFIVKHGADPQLLKNYEPERKTINHNTIQLSMRNFRKVLDITRALGLDAVYPPLISKAVGFGPLSYLPAAVQKVAFEGTMALARSQMAFVSENNPIWAQRMTAVRDILNSGESLALLYPKQDLGYIYGEKGKKLTFDQKYVPSTAPGCRMPHLWLTNVATHIRISSIDLFGQGPQVVLFITGGAPTEALWREAANVVNQKTGQPIIKVAVVVSDASKVSSGSAASTYVDTAGQWASLREVAESGAILVRPDGHVGWRWDSLPVNVSTADQVAGLLREVLNGEVFHLNPKAA